MKNATFSNQAGIFFKTFLFITFVDYVRRMFVDIINGRDFQIIPRKNHAILLNTFTITDPALNPAIVAELKRGYVFTSLLEP